MIKLKVLECVVMLLMLMVVAITSTEFLTFALFLKLGVGVGDIGRNLAGKSTILSCAGSNQIC